MALSGIYAFSQPFSIEIIGLHALSGFVFIAVVVGHILNNIVPLKKYFKHSTAMAVGLAVALITAFFYYQPAPIKAVLGLSGNLGPARRVSPISTHQTLVTNYFWMYEPVQVMIRKTLLI